MPNRVTILDCDCSEDCGCADPGAPDKDLNHCCYCKAETDGCSDPDAPHASSAIYADLDFPYNRFCGCECDPKAAGQVGEWVYSTIVEPVYDADGKQVGTKTLKNAKTWVGDCPDGVQHKPALPDLIECQCQCRYDFYPNLCVEENNEDWGSDPDPNICDCVCNLTDADCVARDPATPKADTDSCSCSCDKPPCPDSTPSFRASDCSCYCDKLDANGDSTCSGDTPDFNASDCSCYCATTSCPSGQKLVGCECVPCPNSCDGCQSYDADCNCTGCANCDDTEFCFRENPSDTEDTCICCGPGLSECGGSCVDTSCPVGQRWDWTTCECGCPNNKVLCNGVCKNPCPAGQSFDANCVCVPDYTQSFLDMSFLP